MGRVNIFQDNNAAHSPFMINRAGLCDGSVLVLSPTTWSAMQRVAGFSPLKLTMPSSPWKRTAMPCLSFSLVDLDTISQLLRNTESVGEEVGVIRDASTLMR